MDRDLDLAGKRRDHGLILALYAFAFIGATCVGLWLGHWLFNAIAAVSCQ